MASASCCSGGSLPCLLRGLCAEASPEDGQFEEACRRGPSRGARPSLPDASAAPRQLPSPPPRRRKKQLQRNFTSTVTTSQRRSRLSLSAAEAEETTPRRRGRSDASSQLRFCFSSVFLCSHLFSSPRRTAPKVATSASGSSLPRSCEETPQENKPFFPCAVCRAPHIQPESAVCPDRDERCFSHRSSRASSGRSASTAKHGAEDPPAAVAASSSNKRVFCHAVAVRRLCTQRREAIVAFFKKFLALLAALLAAAAVAFAARDFKGRRGLSSWVARREGASLQGTAKSSRQTLCNAFKAGRRLRGERRLCGGLT